MKKLDSLDFEIRLYILFSLVVIAMNVFLAMSIYNFFMVLVK